MPQVALGLAASKGLAPVAFFFQVEDHFRAGSLGLSIRNIAIAYHEGDAAYLTPAHSLPHGRLGGVSKKSEP